MNQTTDVAKNVLLLKIILLHEVYHMTGSQLQHLKQIIILSSDVSDQLQSYLEDNKMDIVSFNFAVMYLCAIS